MSIGPHGIGQRGISRRYPAVTGLIAETTKTEGRITNLVPGRILGRKRFRAGL